jgi:hypothetical protein
MFVNKKSSVSEILSSMNDNMLVKEAAEKSAPIKKLASALEHLNAAAEIFDTVGLNKEAEITTKLLERLAQVAPEEGLKQKLMQLVDAIQPGLASQIKWNNFQVSHMGDGLDVSGEFELSPRAEQMLKNTPQLNLANQMSMLAKKADPKVLRAQFIRYSPERQ